ncbi:MAG TPA: hypothetical protein VF950_00255 [Planctomycetota bacterium]
MSTSRKRSGSRSFSRLRLAMAFSTLVQAVFWVRTAPTTTSKGESAGHHFRGP